MPRFSVSLMCMDLLEVKEQLQTMNSKVDAYHIDIMDGHFAPNITLSPDFIAAVRRGSGTTIDAHMMVTDPGFWVDQVAEAGADIYSVHAETIQNTAFRVNNQVRAAGMKLGLVLSPLTPLSSVRPLLEHVELLTLMTVDVGYAGQPFIPEVLSKVAEAKSLKESDGLSYTIQIDGSCNGKTFKQLTDAGAEQFILGNSGLFGLADDLEDAWKAMSRSYDAAVAEPK
ncbi:D-allulose 6-phosphate 3-epimerase [Tessaracoccus sp. Y36]